MPSLQCKKTTLTAGGGEQLTKWLSLSSGGSRLSNSIAGTNAKYLKHNVISPQCYSMYNRSSLIKNLRHPNSMVNQLGLIHKQFSGDNKFPCHVKYEKIAAQGPLWLIILKPNKCMSSVFCSRIPHLVIFVFSYSACWIFNVTTKIYNVNRLGILFEMISGEGDICPIGIWHIVSKFAVKIVSHCHHWHTSPCRVHRCLLLCATVL